MDFFIGSISFYNESNIIMQLKMQIKKASVRQKGRRHILRGTTQIDTW